MCQSQLFAGRESIALISWWQENILQVKVPYVYSVDGTKWYYRWKSGFVHDTPSLEIERKSKKHILARDNLFGILSHGWEQENSCCRQFSGDNYSKSDICKMRNSYLIDAVLLLDCLTILLIQTCSVSQCTKVKYPFDYQTSFWVPEKQYINF